MIMSGSPDRLRSIDPVRVASLEFRACWRAHVADATFGFLRAGLGKLNDLL
jgi:hypothetical protein